MGLTLNSGYGGGGSGSYPTLEVTITNGTATSVTATLGSTVVNLAYDSAASVWRGTLKAFGTWTVEASNGEKTVSDTVDVTNVAVYTASLTFGPLPSGYTQLEYIESTGTQYINTGVGNENGLKCNAEACFTAFGASYDTLCGAQERSGSLSNGSDCLIMRDAATSKYIMWIGSSGAGLTSIEISLNTKTKFEISTQKGNSRFKIGESVATSTDATTRGTKPVFLFAMNDGGSAGFYASGRIYYLELLLVDGTLMRKFIPARRNSDSVLGVYDTVTQTFYTNAGSGTFVAGPDV